MPALAWPLLPVAGGLTAAGLVCALAALYLATLAIAALFPRADGPASVNGVSPPVLAVLVPAYNEADLIRRCIASLDAQSYPQHRYEVVVIADNCSDATALLSERAGARVLVRDEPDARGKGRALRWALDRLMAEESAPHAFVVVDADSTADPDLLAALAQRLQRGAEAVQGDYVALPDTAGRGADLRSAAFVLFHRVRFGGRSRLGLPCSLVGNGMLFSRRLLQRHPWEAFSKTEDLEYAIDLRLAGVGPVFAPDAVVRGPVPTSGPRAESQRARWEGGRLQVVRTAMPKLLREITVHHRWSLIDAAWDLVVPPLGLLAAATAAGAAACALLWSIGLVPAWSLAPWVVGLVAIASYVLIGLYAARAPKSLYRALLWSPAFIVRKVLGTVAVLRSARNDSWIRTERPNESA